MIATATMTPTAASASELRDIAHSVASALVVRLKAAYPEPGQIARIVRANDLVFSGAVLQQHDDGWLVKSQNGTVETYLVTQGTCPCPDQRFNTGPCKHRYAVALMERIAHILGTAYYANLGETWGIVWPEKFGWTFLNLAPDGEMTQGVPMHQVDFGGRLMLPEA